MYNDEALRGINVRLFKSSEQLRMSSLRTSPQDGGDAPDQARCFNKSRVM